MGLTPERFIAQLGSGALAPAYLIAGAEPLHVLEAADAVRAKARAEGVSEREVFEADSRGFDWGLLEASLHAPSLFASRRLLEVRLPTAKPGKDGADLITGFCADPPADVVLLVVGGEWSRQHGGKWSEAIARVGQMVEASPVRPHELPDWITRRLRSRGLQAEREAVLRLVERVEGNLLAAAQEIDKLALLAGSGLFENGTLDAARMESLVADAARYDVFRLVDAAMNGQGAQAARMLAGLRAEGVAVPALMGMLAMELQRAASLAQVQARGGNLAAAFKAQRVWDSKQAAYRRALARHDAARWERFVAALGRIDRSAKGRAQDDPWQGLERLLLAVASSQGAQLLAS